MRIVRFDDDGLAVAFSEFVPAGEGDPPPAGWYPAPDDGPLSDLGQRLALVDGSVVRIWDLRGFSAFGGPAGRTPIEVPNDVAFLGKSWAQLADVGFGQEPRPMTPEEQAAADAAALAAERARAVASPRQFRLALLQLDLLDAVEAIVANPSTSAAVRIEFEYTTEFRRDWPLWAGFLPLIDKTDADLDAVFALAKTL